VGFDRIERVEGFGRQMRSSGLEVPIRAASSWAICFARC
jgi:hypothetical protein